MDPRNMSSDVTSNRIGNEEVRKIRSNATKVTAQSAHKTHEMLQLINECKDAGVHTLQDLYDQGDQLRNTEVALNETDEQLDKAQIRIKNIETANTIPCCCIPCLSCFQKDPDRDRRKGQKKDAEKLNRQPEISSMLPPRSNTDLPGNEERFFPKVLETNEEEEIERNLSHVSSHLSQLKSIALDMNTEVTRQNEQLDKMNEKAEKSVIKLGEATKSTADLVNDTGKSRNTCCCCSIC